MLAASMRPEKGQTIEDLNYPVLASAKLDGIRCVIPGDTPMSRSLKPIPNKHIQRTLSKLALIGLDGELMVGSAETFDTGPIMRHEGKPDFRFMVFDDFTYPNAHYTKRVAQYTDRISRLTNLSMVQAIPTVKIRDFEELFDFTEKCLSGGYEGAMVRDPLGPYKFGRATFKEGYLTKIKPFEDAEATVIGFEEQMENTNEKTTNELGRSKRSSHKAGKVGKNTLGALCLLSDEFGEFNCGTGMDEAMRALVWANRGKYLGKKVTFKFQRIGMKDKPRIPVFKCFRHKDDL